MSILSFLLLAGLAASGVLSADTDSERINQTYDAWVEAANAKDIELWSTFLASGAVFLPPEHKALESSDEITDFYLSLFTDDQFSLDCEQTSVTVAQSGELAWALGWCIASFSSPDGQAVIYRSSDWVKVWIKNRDGAWKCRLNTWNFGRP